MSFIKGGGGGSSSESGTFTVAVSGALTTMGAQEIEYTKQGELAVLVIPTFYDTTTASDNIYLNAMPEALRPSKNRQFVVPIMTNATRQMGVATITVSGGIILFRDMQTNGFASGGVCGAIYPITLAYKI